MSDVTTLVYDTETNGKRPKKPRGAPRDWAPPLTSEPGLVQIAGVLYLGRRPVGHLSCFMPPLGPQGDRRPIPDPDLAPEGLTERDFEFFRKSGITEETVDACGVPFKVGVAMFNNLVRLADRIVAHNIAFDDPIVRAAYSRIACPQRQLWDTPKFCTMKTLEPVLKLPGKYGYKFPTLDESYRALVNPKGFEGAHDAMVDVEACAAVLWAIEDAIAAGDERFDGQQLWQLPESWPPA